MNLEELKNVIKETVPKYGDPIDKADFTGQSLSVGDLVVTCNATGNSGRYLKFGVVVAETPKMVKVTNNWRWKSSINIDTHFLVKTGVIPEHAVEEIYKGVMEYMENKK